MLQAQIDYMYLFPYLIHIVYPYIILFSFHDEMRKPRQVTALVQPMNQLRIAVIK
jgi:hypothetical protein